MKTAELDVKSKIAVAYIAGGFTLVGVIINAYLIYAAR